jgi:hypothetical protein
MMMEKSEPGQNIETHLSQINHVNDMYHVLLFRDGLAAQTYDDIICADAQYLSQELLRVRRTCLC